MPKRKIFEEMMEGIAAMRQYRDGQLTLRNYHVSPGTAPFPKRKAPGDSKKSGTTHPK